MQNDLAAALNPKSIAIIGASDNPHKVGGRPILYMGKYGYKGMIFPINPSRAAIQGHKAYPDLAALPETPDMAIVALAGDGTVQAVEQCARLGVKVAVVLASGFGETGDAGRAAQEAMLATARAAGMRMVGPNSQGLANFGTGAIANFSTIFNDSPCLPGPVAVISQSGALSQLIYSLLYQRGIGLRHCHATGNEADITVGELAAQVADDPDVRLILLYMETINRPGELARAAMRAQARDLPVVALKSGRTERGQRAAMSHTGSAAIDDARVDRFLDRLGIWRADDPQALVNASELYLKGWSPRERGLVAISNSGATCVMVADTAAGLGLPLAVLGAGTRDQLQGILPGFATTANPIDMTGALLSNSSLFGKTLEIAGADPAAELLFVGFPIAGTGYDIESFARDAARFIDASGKPLVISVPQADLAAPFIRLGVPVFASDRDALLALRQIAAHGGLRRRARLDAKACAEAVALLEATPG